MKIAVVAPKVPSNIKNLIDVKQYKIYACDSAVIDLINQKIPIELAIGDFDSLKSPEILDDIKTIKLSVIKDDSDTAYALRHAYQQTDDVILIGGVKGNRSDHLVANLLLLEKYPNLIILDDTNKIQKLIPGVYTFTNKHKYISIFPLEDSVLNLNNALYPLKEERLFKFDFLGLSNQII